MPVRIENIMAVEDVGGGDKTLEEILESDLLALRKISDRHVENKE